MDKNAIQKYAIWARNELIAQVKQRAFQYGISGKSYGEENASVINGRVLTPDEKRQQQDFVHEIQKNGFEQAVEEVAYTWFNRFVALRFMEVNDYLPAHVRVFSDASGGFDPEILKDVLRLDLEGLDKAKVSTLLNANQTEELYRYLLLTQCNALNAALPEMFEKLGGYTEMLLPNNILKQDSILARLVKDIDEDAWKDAVQIIGWLYQYYNTEPKQAVFDGLKKNIKITKEKIPAATQLFTPDWIVRYMVENSLGRLWLEGHPNSDLKAGWMYYLDEAEQTPEVAAHLAQIRKERTRMTPEDIKVIDPCMGSGHILVYAFDVLMQIYLSAGYTERDAAKLILEMNLHGMDIDRRAYQLAYFALMMKARQHNRRIFSENAKPQVYHPAGWEDGEEYGSLILMDNPSARPREPQKPTLFDDYEGDLRIWNYKRLLAQTYDVVVTNPPYMSSSGMGGRLSQYVKDHYPDSKSDLFAAFIERCNTFVKPNAYQAMITQHAWMFLSSFEKLRSKLLLYDMVNMTHLGTRAFAEIGGEVVQTTAFVTSNRRIIGYRGIYIRLVGIDDAQKKQREFLSGNNRYFAVSSNFTRIPGSPVAYWVSDQYIISFDTGKPIDKLSSTRQGMIPGNVDAFVREWYEVSTKKIGFEHKRSDDISTKGFKWFPYNKGGGFRRWYGNIEHLINMENDGFDIKNSGLNNNYRLREPELYFQEAVTWSKIGSGAFSARYMPVGCLFDIAGCCIFELHQRIWFVLGLLNSCVSDKILNILSPTLNYEVDHIKKVPVITNGDSSIDAIVINNVEIAKTDWDSFETSWDFKKHPLI